MDLQGSLVNTNLSIYPSNKFIEYFKSLPIDDNVPTNIVKFVKGKDYAVKQKENNEDPKKIPVYLNSEDIDNLNKIKATIKIDEAQVTDIEDVSEETNTEENLKSNDSNEVTTETNNDTKKTPKYSEDDFNEKAKILKEDSSENTKQSKENCNEKTKNKDSDEENKLYLITSDIVWLYDHLQKLRSNSVKDVPYLHELLEGAEIRTPKNVIIKRNPDLEARCVKLRAQQESREYRKMTKSVDNVRMRFPEDSISYQLKQVNRQLIAIGQFIISIFAGFLFGFKGVEWMIGNLDFGFRLLLGVMCALIIALAEIYFLAKKLNEELNVPETIQLGGPPKFVDQQTHYTSKVSNKAIDKEHKD